MFCHCYCCRLYIGEFGCVKLLQSEREGKEMWGGKGIERGEKTVSWK